MGVRLLRHCLFLLTQYERTMVMTASKLLENSKMLSLSRDCRQAIKNCFREPEAKFVAALFLLFAMPTTLLLALLVPPGEVADEPAHLARAASLLRGEVIARPINAIVDGKPTRIGALSATRRLLMRTFHFRVLSGRKESK